MSGRVWYAVEVVAEPAAVEAVESALNECGAVGTEVNGLRKKPNEPLQITGFFEERPDTIEIDTAINLFLTPYDLGRSSVLSVRSQTVQETDWLAEWKKHWRPTSVGRFVIAPPWDELPTTDAIVIRIEPNMAFGTGTHETTQLCLSAMGDLYRPGESFMDVGTGTGILAIAAAKLGAANVFAVDTDQDSVTIARENAALNNTPNIQFANSPVDADTPDHDFVCANLTLDVIEPLLPLLLDRSRRILVLSGILVEQEAAIVGTLHERGVKHQVDRKGEWISVVIDRAS
jgi:ribosomal protein L11 methyltransferase